MRSRCSSRKPRRRRSATWFPRGQVILEGAERAESPSCSAFAPERDWGSSGRWPKPSHADHLNVPAVFAGSRRPRSGPHFSGLGPPSGHAFGLVARQDSVDTAARCSTSWDLVCTRRTVMRSVWRAYATIPTPRGTARTIASVQAPPGPLECSRTLAQRVDGPREGTSRAATHRSCRGRSRQRPESCRHADLSSTSPSCRHGG